MARIKVIHLEIDGEHHYFGSLKALHEAMGDRLGMKFNSFHSNVRVTPEMPYVNRRKGYIIRMGILPQTKTNRRPPSFITAAKQSAVAPVAETIAEPVVKMEVKETSKSTKASKKGAPEQLDLFGF